MVEVVKTVRAFTGAADKDMTFETGLLAPLAGASITAKVGDTVALVTATAADKPRDGVDFFPLTVDVEERMYAAGKIPGSFFRREARAGEQAILACRLIDRPLRPLFPKGFRNEVHIVVNVLGADQIHDYDIAALNAASLALCLSPVPFNGPVGAVKLAWSSESQWIPFPTHDEVRDAAFEMVVAGNVVDSDVNVLMVEAGGTALTWELYQSGTLKVDEEVLIDGLEASKVWIRETIELQQEMISKVSPAQKMNPPLAVDYSEDIMNAVKGTYYDRISAVHAIADKAERHVAESGLHTEIVASVKGQFAERDGVESEVRNVVSKLSKEVVRNRIVTQGVRIDGRRSGELRTLISKVGLIPTAHGSGLFQRGETQVLNVTTLGLGKHDLLVDDLSPVEKKRYFHHYNFPPFSTGEAGVLRGPRRREIGHGALAEKALVPVVPGYDDWPYTIRTVSEVLSSNGSSSMASVCGSTLSLMDAGVPIKAPVAGVAMGLVRDGDTWVTLTDIIGAEDAFGDMDFKVAGTTDFVTALQLDMKVTGVPAHVLASALRQAYEARLDILDVMAEAIIAPRAEVSDRAPKIVSFEIPSEKIGEVIGPKGKMINSIQAGTGTEINVTDHDLVGNVTITSVDRESVIEAERQIKLILDPPTADIGKTYRGRVVNITKFGAFVNILPGRDGLLHISKIGGNKRINRVEDVLTLGEEINVVVEDIDPNGKISFVMADNNGNNSGGSGKSSQDTSHQSTASSHYPSSHSSSRRKDNFSTSSQSSEGRRSNTRGTSARGSRGRGSDRENAAGRTMHTNKSASKSRQRPGKRTASFEDVFNSELRKEFGDLGPEQPFVPGRRRR